MTNLTVGGSDLYAGTPGRMRELPVVTSSAQTPRLAESGTDGTRNYTCGLADRDGDFYLTQAAVMLGSGRLCLRMGLGALQTTNRALFLGGLAVFHVPHR